MPLLRRRFALAGLSSLPLLSAGLSARAQTTDFPDRPLRFVVGFPPGGPNDLLARIVAPGIAERLKRSVVVENRAGANGEIAAASVAKAVPDGSVFMLASNGSTTVAPALNPNMSYDVRIDFAAVAPVGINPMLLVVRPDLPAKDVAGLLALARDRPANSTARRPAPAAPPIWRSSFSSRWARSTSCMCPTRAADRPWRI